jgi:hypothetical protein
MTDGQVTVLIAAITWIFAAGGILTWARMSITQVKKDMDQMRLNLYRDINGLGKRGRKNQESADRRYHNLCMAAMIAAPNSKEAELAGLLREGR